MDIISDSETTITNLKPGETTRQKLKYGGYLFLEHDVPFLMIYRNIPNDEATIRLARTGASYLIIGESHFDYFHDVVNQVTEKMSQRFGSFMLLEIYSGPTGSSDFIIRGPSHKLPTSLKVLQTELKKIAPPEHLKLPVEAKIEQTKQRLNPAHKKFFSIDEIKNRGGAFIGLQIPPIYRDHNGKLFPVYFKTFRNEFSEAIYKSAFEFIRIQTTSELKYYTAVGKRNIHEELLKIDKHLTEIEHAYNFLLLVAPVNIQSIRSAFFDSKFEEINPYSYRLLPVDPDLLKRRLYNLRIDEIDDPALAYLFEEKREEIDQELTMLKERGSKNFFYSSLRLYGGIEKDILYQAKLILENIPEDTLQQNQKDLDAHGFAQLAQQEFNYFKKQDEDFSSKIHIRKDVNVMMVSNGELFLPADYTMTKKEAAALIQHEVGTHVLTFFNGSKQPLSQLSQGLANYDSLQEGMAVLSEYFTGCLTPNRMRTLAGRVIAGEALLDDADFKEVFNLLCSTYGFSKEPAFNITSRIFQGSGFLKDIIYLRGMVRLMEYLQHNGDFEFLLSGKYALEQVPLIKNLTQREILKPAKIKPRYLQSDTFNQCLKKIRNGISLCNMVVSS